MEKICKNCKHYSFKRTDLRANKAGWFKSSSCNCPKFQYGYRINLGDIGKDEILVESDEGWGCQPNKKFGCIHFKPKGFLKK